MVIHGDADPLVPVSEGRRTRSVYEREGHVVEYIEVPGLGHRWARGAGINRRIWGFFRDHPRR
jgi:predicted esterase